MDKNHSRQFCYGAIGWLLLHTSRNVFFLAEKKKTGKHNVESSPTLPVIMYVIVGYAGIHIIMVVMLVVLGIMSFFFFYPSDTVSHQN